jgi:thiol:disulfide interchange protein DsbD
MRPRALVLLLAFFSATAAFAQIEIGAGPGGGIDAGPKLSITGSVHKRAGDDVEGTITATIEHGWHVNSHQPLDEFAIPTTLKLDEATATLTSAQFPPHQLKAFGFSGGKQLAVYEGEIRIPFVAKLKSGATTINATVNYQACNDNICLQPKNATAAIDAVTLAAAPATNANFTPLSAAPKGAKAATGDKLVDTFTSKGLPLTLVLLFLGGLALNLTPCVFPLIPITLGFFSMQSDGRRSRRFALSFMYVLGIVITYSILGVAAALSGQILGAWLQLPIVLIGFAIGMLVLASSMFGAFEIQPPQWITKRSSGQAGLAGALTMGLLIGIVAAPCVGPVVISLITLVAQLGDPVKGGLMFATLAFGLGFPYLALLNALPRPGEWMVTVKKGMGFVLIGMAFYFVRPLLGDEVMRWGITASLLVGAAFLFFSRTQGGKAMRYGVATLLLAGGIFFAWPKDAGASVTWAKYDSKALAAAAAAKKPVIIDFYADWCLPCKELDEKTFSDEKVAAEMQRFIRVKADLTAPDDEQTKALTKQYTIYGVPTIVFLDSSGREVTAQRLTGFEPPEKYLERLRQIR